MTSTTPVQRWRHIELILDRSISMHAIKDQTEDGIRAFLSDQRQVDGRTTVSLTQFDDEPELVFANCDLANVPEIRLEPRGNTAMLDAIGQTITRTRRFVRGRPKPRRPDEIIIVILTDGHENASHAFDSPTVRAMIGELRGKKRSWQFVFMGATTGVEAFAWRLGIAPSSVVRFDHDLSEAALTAASHMIRRGSESGLYRFTDEERRATRH
ncbi:MAG TPA: vWA domain-containing protein [Nonomuraea sp.]|nr:vWA domain-containing protein [Nonomuraea sp.]